MGSAAEDFALLSSAAATPIAQLGPDLPDQPSRVVRGQVTVVWPYSRVAHTLAFVLAEADAVLRPARGQIRVQLRGSSAKRVAAWNLGPGDAVALSLEGAQWEKDVFPARVPDSRVGWQLEFAERLKLEARVDDAQVHSADIDHPLPDTPPEPTQDDSQQTPPTPLPISTPPPAQPESNDIFKIDISLFRTPAYLKRARPHLEPFEDSLDDLEEDGGAHGKGRKRARFEQRRRWRYSSLSPSPEAESRSPEQDVTMAEPPAKRRMVDEGCQTVDLDFPPVVITPVVPTIPADSATPAAPVVSSTSPAPAVAESTDYTAEELQPHSHHKSPPRPPSASPAREAEAESVQPETESAQHPVADVVRSQTLFGDLSWTNRQDQPSSQLGAAIPGQTDEGLGISDRVRFGFSHGPATGLSPAPDQESVLSLPPPSSSLPLSAESSSPDPPALSPQRADMDAHGVANSEATLPETTIPDTNPAETNSPEATLSEVNPPETTLHETPDTTLPEAAPPEDPTQPDRIPADFVSCDSRKEEAGGSKGDESGKREELHDSGGGTSQPVEEIAKNEVENKEVENEEVENEEVENEKAEIEVAEVEESENEDENKENENKEDENRTEPERVRGRPDGQAGVLTEADTPYNPGAEAVEGQYDPRRFHSPSDDDHGPLEEESEEETHASPYAVREFIDDDGEEEEAEEDEVEVEEEGYSDEAGSEGDLGSDEYGSGSDDGSIEGEYEGEYEDEEEENDYQPWTPSSQPTAAPSSSPAAPQAPVVISLLSDSEDEDEEPAAPAQPVSQPERTAPEADPGQAERRETPRDPTPGPEAWASDRVPTPPVPELMEAHAEPTQDPGHIVEPNTAEADGGVDKGTGESYAPAPNHTPPPQPEAVVAEREAFSPTGEAVPMEEDGITPYAMSHADEDMGSAGAGSGDEEMHDQAEDGHYEEDGDIQMMMMEGADPIDPSLIGFQHGEMGVSHLQSQPRHAESGEMDGLVPAFAHPHPEEPLLLSVQPETVASHGSPMDIDVTASNPIAIGGEWAAEPRREDTLAAGASPQDQNNDLIDLSPPPDSSLPTTQGQAEIDPNLAEAAGASSPARLQASREPTEQPPTSLESQALDGASAQAEADHLVSQDHQTFLEESEITAQFERSLEEARRDRDAVSAAEPQESAQSRYGTPDEVQESQDTKKTPDAPEYVEEQQHYDETTEMPGSAESPSGALEEGGNQEVTAGAQEEEEEEREDDVELVQPGTATQSFGEAEGATRDGTQDTLIIPSSPEQTVSSEIHAASADPEATAEEDAEPETQTQEAEPREQSPPSPSEHQGEDAITVKPLRKSRRAREAKAQDGSPPGPTTQPSQAVATPTRKTAPRRAAAESVRSSARVTRAMSGGGSQKSATPEFEDANSSFSSLPPPPPSSSAGPDATSSSLKTDLTRRLRTELPRYTALKNIRGQLNKSVSVAAVATTQPAEPQRAKRQYMMSFLVTDQTLGPGHVAEVQFFHAHKDALPTVAPGDAIVLRGFHVVSLTKKGFGLRTADDESAWAVCSSDGEAGSGSGDRDRDQAGRAAAEAKGSAAVLDAVESSYAASLRLWYGSLDDAARAKLHKANQKLA